MDIKRIIASRKKRARRGVASAITVAILILVVYAMFAYVFGIAISNAKTIGNSYAPGSLQTGDAIIFTDILNYSAVIAIAAAFLMIVILSQRRTEF